MPEEYGNLITQSDYERILDLSLAYLTTKGTVNKVGNGTIYMKFDDQEYESRLGFDNLVRKCHKHDPQEWNSVISEHFSKYRLNKPALEYIFKDFEFAAQLLKPLIKPAGTIPAEFVQDFVQRVDFEETHTFIVIDFEDKFQFLRLDNISEWEVSVEDLFYIAQQNANKEPIEMRHINWDEMSFYALFSGNFSVSYILDLKTNLPEAIGTFGTFVAIPTKGVAIAFPIESMQSLVAFIQVITGLVMQYYNEDESPITDNYYWYYDEKFHLFPYQVGDGNKTLFPPLELLVLMGNDGSQEEDNEE